MKQKTSFYFVLYIVAIVSLLDVITERDDAQREIISILISKITEAPKLSVRDTLVWVAKDTSRSVITASGLTTQRERRSIKYQLEAIEKRFPEGLSPIITIDSLGNGFLSGRVPVKGSYRLRVRSEVERDLPSDLPEAVQELIHRQLGDRIPLKSDPVEFVLKVDAAAAEAPGLTLNVEPPKDDRWIVGIPYSKTIYVGGPSTERMSFHVSDNRFSITKDIGKVILRWANPIAGDAPVSVTVGANANRGLAQILDLASISFSVSVTPARWDREPEEQAFWDVPFQFNSGVRGLDPGKYSIQIIANGSTLLKTISPVEFPYTVVPERTWTTLSFSAVSLSNNELISKDVAVKKPMPPLIRWASGTWQGNDYVMKFSSVDVNGSDVNVDFCSVILPEDIVSKLDTRRGKSFSLTISNLKTAKPSAVRVKVTVSGIGGQRSDQITHPIIY